MSINAIILAAGMGTRLQGIVDDIPKALININKKPFIIYLFDQLLKAKINRVIICTGHLSEKFPDLIGYQYKKLEIIYSTEIEPPSGTGGAIAKATNLILSDKCLVMNGDSYINTHLDKFMAWHEKNDYLGSILITNAKKENHYGNIKISTAGRITDFSEKNNIEGKKYINAGIYILDMKLIRDIPMNRDVSLEHDCFPFWIDDGLGGFYRRAKFIDIGTPESLKEAQQFFKRKKRKKRKK